MRQGASLLITSSLAFALLGACHTSAPTSATPTSTALEVTLVPTIPTGTLPPTQTLIPTSTQVPTQTPWPTATALPIPTLITHTWQAGPVLMQYASTSGDGGIPFYNGIPTVLYVDGTFITGKWNTNHAEIMQGKLNRKETCALLNAIDQTGFFSLAPEEWFWNAARAQYDGYAVGEGAPGVILDARAWVTQTVNFYELDILLDVLKDEPDTVKSRYVPKAIRDVYALEAYLRARPLKRYAPDRFLFTVTSYGKWTEGKDWPKWPLSFPLSTLISPTVLYEWQLVPYAIEGPEVTWLYKKYYQHIPSYDGVNFNEDGVAYSVTAFPLLPMESFNGRVNYELTIPSADVPITTTTMTCYPTDGVLPIPAESER